MSFLLTTVSLGALQTSFVVESVPAWWRATVPRTLGDGKGNVAPSRTLLGYFGQKRGVNVTVPVKSDGRVLRTLGCHNRSSMDTGHFPFLVFFTV